MFPTSSSTDLVGRNARSLAAARINGVCFPHSGLAPDRTRQAGTSLLRKRVDPNGEPNTGASRAAQGPRTGLWTEPAWWYVPPALSAWRLRICAIVAGVCVTLALAGCGGGQNQAASEPSGHFPVTISAARFPSSQRLSQHTHLVIGVHNSGDKPIPNIAVTLCNVTCAYPAPKGEGTSSQAFAADSNQAYLANPSRPLWIVDRAPGACSYSCQNGAAAGAAVTAYTANTGALGRLGPGKTARFDWAVTPVQAGKHVVAWQVAAGLNGKAKAVLSNGSMPHGTFAVKVDSAPAQSYVNNNGQIVTKQVARLGNGVQTAALDPRGGTAAGEVPTQARSMVPWGLDRGRLTRSAQHPASVAARAAGQSKRPSLRSRPIPVRSPITMHARPENPDRARSCR